MVEFMLPENRIPHAVRNEWFYLIARGCMIFATVIGLPIAGWLMTRVIAKADEISDKLISQNVELKLLATEVRMSLSFDARNLSDHEGRLRSLEKK